MIYYVMVAEEFLPFSLQQILWNSKALCMIQENFNGRIIFFESETQIFAEVNKFFLLFHIIDYTILFEIHILVVLFYQ